MKTRIIPRKPAYIVTLGILILASFLAGTIASREQPVNAQRVDSVAELATPAGAHVCTIYSIAVYGVRVQVTCTTAVGGISAFAAPFASAAESRQTNRLLAMLISARALNKQVVLYYNDNSAFNPPGCNAADCRLLESVVW